MQHHPKGGGEESPPPNFGWCCFFPSPFGWCCFSSHPLGGAAFFSSLLMGGADWPSPSLGRGAFTPGWCYFSGSQPSFSGRDLSKEKKEKLEKNENK